jgi:tricorn protease
MLINEYTGSGGDALAHYFRQATQGPLIGKRTWGGLIGTHRIPKLIDGGEVTAPDLAGTLPNGTLLLENKGEQPDEEVELSPEAWNSGQDSQLEAAISKALELLNHK